MDPAEAAAMSDPDRNRWFRRRWHEPLHERPMSRTTPAAIELTGRALLEAWRRERVQEQAGSS